MGLRDQVPFLLFQLIWFSTKKEINNENKVNFYSGAISFYAFSFVGRTKRSISRDLVF